MSRESVVHKESIDIEVRREELVSFVHQLSSRLLATAPRPPSPPPLFAVPVPHRGTATTTTSSGVLTASAQGSGSPQASQIRAHVGGPISITAEATTTTTPISSTASSSPSPSPPPSPKRAAAPPPIPAAVHPPTATSPPPHPQPLPGFLVPTTPMFPDMFKPGRINLTEIFATEPVDSKDSIQRIIYSAQLPGLDMEALTSGWLLSVAQHTMHLWKCSAPADVDYDDAEYVPVELRHTRVVDERILSTDIAESSRLLIAGTGGPSGKAAVSGMTLFSIVGESFLEPRGRITTQIDPVQVLSLDQLRGAVANSVCCSQKTHVFIYDIKGSTGGAPKASWKAHETDVTQLRRNVALGCVATGAWRGDVSFWDLRKPPNKPSAIFIKHQRTITGIELAGQSFMMTSSSDGYLNVWDVRRPSSPLHTTTPDRSPVLCVRNLPNTYTFAVATTKGLYVFDGQTNSIARVTTTLQQPSFSSLQWDLNTANLYASLSNAITCFKIGPRK